MQEVRKLVSNGNTLGAIDLLIENGNQDALLLKARLTAAKRERNLGVMDTQEWQRINAQISFAVLSLCPVGANHEPENRALPVGYHGLDTWLLQIIAANKRRNETLSNEAQSLLSQYRQHQDEKAKNPSFDPAGRRLDGILKEIKDFKYALEEKGKDSLESTVSRINDLISDRVPTYEKLQEAYNLAVGRGMNSKEVDRMLSAKADDEEPRIFIAERIESFLSTI